MENQNLYSHRWFEHQKGGAKASAQVILPIVESFVSPKSVVDVGCGTGAWLEYFTNKGMKDVWGVDGDWIEESQLRIPKENFRKVDMSAPFSVGKKADLALCLEVGEHLKAEVSDGLIKSLTEAAPVVLFSAAIPHQPGTGHVNGQWPDYWAAIFKRCGYVSVDCIRRRVWTNPSVEYWYAQNAILYVREKDLKRYPRLEDEIRCGYSDPLPLVHPRRYHYAVQPPLSLMYRVVRKFKHLVGILPKK